VILYRVQSSDSFFNFQYPVLSLRSSNSCLHLHHHLVTSILPYIFSSVMCFSSQFLYKMSPVQLAFILFIVCRVFLSSWPLCNTSYFLTQLDHLISILFQHQIANLYRCLNCLYRNDRHSKFQGSILGQLLDCVQHIPITSTCVTFIYGEQECKKLMYIKQ
jgi:hypothetical protein